MTVTGGERWCFLFPSNVWHNSVRTPQLPAPLWKNIHIEISYTDLAGSRRVPLTLSTVSRDNHTAAQMQFRLFSFALIVLELCGLQPLSDAAVSPLEKKQKRWGNRACVFDRCFINNRISHLADASIQSDLRSAYDMDCPTRCYAAKNYHGNRSCAFRIFL